jgi:hypothetical protein
MLKRLFDWTPRDIAYWEKIRRYGLGRFILRYGLVITGGLLFLIFGLITVFIWIRQIAGYPFTLTSLLFLLWQLLVVALVCQVAGLINSLVTWVVEERLYRKYTKGN